MTTRTQPQIQTTVREEIAADADKRGQRWAAWLSPAVLILGMLCGGVAGYYSSQQQLAVHSAIVDEKIRGIEEARKKQEADTLALSLRVTQLQLDVSTIKADASWTRRYLEHKARW